MHPQIFSFGSDGEGAVVCIEGGGLDDARGTCGTGGGGGLDATGGGGLDDAGWGCFFE